MQNLISKQRKIEITELPSELPDFTESYEPKDSIIKKWLIDWILNSVKEKTIKENDILPKKSEISNYLGVSIGTVQNAIRYVEDEGFLKSKQKLGTMISNLTNPFENIKKSTSRRDKAIEKIKSIIIEKKYKINKPIPSSRKMAEYIGISQNTTRLAYEYLCSLGILESKQIRGNEANWILKEIPGINVHDYTNIDISTSDTLVSIVTNDLKEYLINNLKLGEKIPSHDKLSKELNVSIKTIHDAVSILNNEGILISRRGRYGTIYAKNPVSESFKINSIFANADDAAFYNYQKIENKLIDLINSEYNIGDKLSSMQELSKKFDVSTNTIRKALNNLAEQGYITFGRGRYGGTFIVDKPSKENQQYQWIAINPEYM